LAACDAFFAADTAGIDPAVFAGHGLFACSCAEPSIPAIALPRFDKLRCSSAPVDASAENCRHNLSANRDGCAADAYGDF
jgi:hypothetical protein